MFRSTLKIFIVGFVLIGVSPGRPGAEAQKAPGVFISVAELSRGLDDGWEAVFAFVRDQVRFEPSEYLLKSPSDVLWGRSGNAVEQSLLLAEALRERGEEVLLVSGRLDRADAAALIDSMFPEKKDFDYGGDVPLSTPGRDDSLIAAVRDHHWVRIREGDEWLDLDPAFPGSAPGNAHAEVEETWETLPDEAFPVLTITLSVDKGGETDDVLEMEERLADLANRPVSLSISTRFEETEGETSSGGTVGGVFGALGGGSSGKKAKKGVRAVYSARMTVEDDMEESGEFDEKIPEKSKSVPDEDVLRRVWLSFALTADGESLLESERVLFDKHETSDEFPLFQRHSLLITANAVPPKSWEGDLARVTDPGVLEQVRSRVDDIKKSIQSKKDKDDLLRESLSLEERLGDDLGHLINMIFASSSDSLTRDSGRALSVLSWYPRPRILITSVEGDEKKTVASLDLRQDGAAALPFPGQARAMSETFLYGRGVFESVLEGKILELFSGRKTLTTASLMREAAKRKIPIRFYFEADEEGLENLELPGPALERARASLDDGYVLILPDRPIRFDGEDRWGWWRIDPHTREATGVLDSGLHQSVLQRTILDTKGMLDSRMGFAIGAITGAVDTQWMLAAKTLDYGEINKQALQEIKAYMKELKTYMCPEFEKTASATLASATVINIEDCYKKEYSLSVEAGVKIDMGWCQSFAKGFACASTSILNYYLSQYE